MKPMAASATGETDRRAEVMRRLDGPAAASAPCVRGPLQHPRQLRSPCEAAQQLLVGLVGASRALGRCVASGAGSRRWGVLRDAASSCCGSPTMACVAGCGRRAAAARPVPSRIWWRQEKPSAAMIVSGAAPGARPAAATARPWPWRPRRYRRRSRRRRPCRSSSNSTVSSPRSAIAAAPAPAWTEPMTPNAFWWQWPCSRTLPRACAIDLGRRPAAASRARNSSNRSAWRPAARPRRRAAWPGTRRAG